MENSAGAGGTIGRSIEELATIYERLGRPPRLGVCLDSCHLYVSGIDVTDPAALDACLDEVDASIGLDRLRALHVNDSKEPLGSNRDRHENIGEGLMGERLGVFLGNPRLQGLPAVLETAGPDGSRPRRGRDPQDEGAARPLDREVRSRYRWVILAAGTTAQASFSAALIGLPALAPALRTQYDLTLGETGVVLGAMSLGHAADAAAVGAPRRPDRRARGDRARARGRRRGARRSPAVTTSFGPLVATLALAGALGASVNSASGRAVMGWFDEDERGLALGIRQAAVPIGGAIAAVALPLARVASEGRSSRSSRSAAASSSAAPSRRVLLREAPHRRAGADGRRSLDRCATARMWLLAGGSSLYLDRADRDHELRRPVPPRAPRALDSRGCRRARGRSTSSAIGDAHRGRPLVGPHPHSHCAAAAGRARARDGDASSPLRSSTRRSRCSSRR